MNSSLNLGNITEEITNTFSNDFNNIFKSVLSSLFEKFKIVIVIIFLAIGVYLLWVIIRFILNRIKERRIKETHENSQLILKKIESIERKLGINSDKTEKKEIPEKKLKDKSKSEKSRKKIKK